MRGRGLRENILLLAVVGTAAAAIGYCSTASADTLEWALVQAYQTNPSLNAQRAALRAVDRMCRRHFQVIARNSVSLHPAATITSASSTNPSTNKRFQTLSSTTASASRSVPGNSARPRPKRFSTDFKPPIARGKRKSEVAGARETLRVTEQQVLLDAAT